MICAMLVRLDLNITERMLDNSLKIATTANEPI